MVFEKKKLRYTELAEVVGCRCPGFKMAESTVDVWLGLGKKAFWLTLGGKLW